MPPATTRDDFSQFLRDQAAECLHLANRTPNAAIAAELLALAALFHEHATRIEASSRPAPADSC